LDGYAQYVLWLQWGSTDGTSPDSLKYLQDKALREMSFRITTNACGKFCLDDSVERNLLDEQAVVARQTWMSSFASYLPCVPDVLLNLVFQYTSSAWSPTQKQKD
jgi:hypothetical protein